MTDAPFKYVLFPENGEPEKTVEVGSLEEFKKMIRGYCNTWIFRDFTDTTFIAFSAFGHRAVISTTQEGVNILSEYSFKRQPGSDQFMVIF